MGKKSDIANNENANTEGFAKNPQNINKKGRPKKIYNHIKEMGYHESQIKDVFRELVFYTMAELLALKEDATQPAIVLIVGKNLYKAIKSGKVADVKEILDSIVEKPTQKTKTDFTFTEPITGMEIT